MDVNYICDRKACGNKCSYPICKHTSDINHAVNFEKKTRWDGEPVFMEKEDMRVEESFNRLQEMLRRLQDSCI